MSIGFELDARCPWCGPIVVDPAEVRCAIDPSHVHEGLAELSCPACDRLVLFLVSAAAAAVLRSAGAAEIEGAVPFELLEPHGGPPISADEVLDVHAHLNEGCCPQDELTNGSVR